MIRTIKTFIKDPPPVDTLDQVEPGLNIVDGLVVVDEPLRSPVRGQNCAAFFYRSFLMITESRAPTIHKLREAEVYTSFTLRLPDGEIAVEPRKRGSFDSEDHRRLGTQYGKGFQGVEEVILPGARVRVRGKVRFDGDRAVLRMSDIEVLEKQEVAAGVTGDRKQRRKKKR